MCCYLQSLGLICRLILPFGSSLLIGLLFFDGCACWRALTSPTTKWHLCQIFIFFFLHYHKETCAGGSLLLFFFNDSHKSTSVAIAMIDLRVTACDCALLPFRHKGQELGICVWMCRTTRGSNSLQPGGWYSSGEISLGLSSSNSEAQKKTERC